ncbi:MAG: hypothetical protein NT028_11045, partial [candidate division Zixibacteria bacterium]|nr:hypothetical protein [candidate division Zixibacteria bacterium]
IRPYDGMGCLADRLSDARSVSNVKLRKAELNDLTKRIAISKALLDLPESPRELVDAFLEGGFIEEKLKQTLQKKAGDKR